MMGDPEQFQAFRMMFRRHISGATEPELAETKKRLQLLQDDVTLREEYLKTITPLAITHGGPS